MGKSPSGTVCCRYILWFAFPIRLRAFAREQQCARAFGDYPKSRGAKSRSRSFYLSSLSPCLVQNAVPPPSVQRFVARVQSFEKAERKIILLVPFFFWKFNMYVYTDVWEKI